MASIPIKISKIGFCNFKFEDGQIPDGWEAPSDISNHYGIEFSFEYSWNGNHCYITNIQSEPIELDNTRTIKRNIELQSIEFKNDKCLTIDFNSTSLVNSESEFDTTIYGNEPKVYLGENENLEYEVTNSSYMLANFKYENRTQSGNQEDGFSTVVYYIDIPNIKIPKPSKYENNVVFTEEGVKELVGEVESKVSKGGDIMTGDLVIQKKSGAAQFISKKLNTDGEEIASVSLSTQNNDANTDNQEHGLWSAMTINGQPNTKWMIYRNNQGNVIVNGNADTASKLVEAKKLKVNLASTEDVKFDGSADQTSIPVDGILPVEHGGTGVNDLSELGSELGLDSNDDNTRLFVKRSGDTMTNTLNINNGSLNVGTNTTSQTQIKQGGIEIKNSTTPYIDFWYNKTATNNNNDYNVRLANTESGLLRCEGKFSTASDTTIGGALSVSGATTLNNNLTVGSSSAAKNTTLNGNLTISNSGKLILNAKIYGSSAPTARNDLSGEEGQIYFQLVN